MGKTGRIGAALVLALVVSGCERGDARLEQLTVGISKDSVVAVMGAPARRVDPFLSRGQYIEAMYFAKDGGSGAEARTDRSLSPVIVVNGQLAGWGWTYWDSVATEHNIPVEPKN